MRVHRSLPLGPSRRRSRFEWRTAPRRPRAGSLGAATAITLLLACSSPSDGGAGPDAGPIVSFDAFPATLRPGTPVALRPVFTRGSGRVEPDVGTVESGGSYLVGPFTTARTYTLVVTDGAAERRPTLELPFDGVPFEQTPTATAEIWEPSSGEFTPTGSLAAGRAFATSALILTGGSPGNDFPVAAAELYE